MKRFLLSAVTFAAMAGQAGAQSSPGFFQGQIPTAAQWNSYFSTKMDNSGAAVSNALGYIPLSPANNLSDVANPATAAANLGAASTSANNTWSGTQTFSGAVSGGNFAISGGTISNSTLSSIASIGVTGALTAGSLQSLASGAITAGQAGSRNTLTMTPTTTGTFPSFAAGGVDAVVGIRFQQKGGGTFSFNGPLSVTAPIANTPIIAFSGSAGSSATNSGIWSSQVYTGSSTNTGILTLNNWTMNDGISDPGNNIFGYNFAHGTNATTTGNRIAFGVTLFQNAARTTSESDPAIGDQGAQITNFVDFDFAGASSSNLLGIHYGFSSQMRARQAVNVGQLIGFEQDIGAVAGSVLGERFGIAISGSESVRGQQADGALFFPYTSGVGISGGWRDVILFGGNNGNPANPTEGSYIRFTAGGNYSIGDHPGIAQWFSDMGQATFPSTGTPNDGGFLRGPGGARGGFSVDGIGTTQIGTAYLTPSTAGVAIDTKGSVSTGATRSANGSGYVDGLHAFKTRDFGGLWLVQVIGGVATGTPTQVNAAVISSTTPPSNPVVMIEQFRNGTVGSGMTFNLTWNTTATQISLQPSGGVLKIGSGMATANGSVATAMSSLGPTGSHTTVQEWLTVTNASGVVRYIPAF